MNIALLFLYSYLQMTFLIIYIEYSCPCLPLETSAELSSISWWITVFQTTDFPFIRGSKLQHAFIIPLLITSYFSALELAVVNQANLSGRTHCSVRLPVLSTTQCPINFCSTANLIRISECHAYFQITHENVEKSLRLVNSLKLLRKKKKNTLIFFSLRTNSEIGLQIFSLIITRCSFFFFSFLHKNVSLSLSKNL